MYCSPRGLVFNHIGGEPVKKNLYLIGMMFILFFSCGQAVRYPSSAGTFAPAASQACTSFCLDNNGCAVFGTNYDHYTVYEGLVFVNKKNVVKTAQTPSTTGKYASWTSRYGSVTFNLVGYQYVWAGMNEAGLVISTMNLGYATQNPLPDERPPLDSCIWVQYQLDNCSTVEDVIASDSLIRIAHTVDHYLVCDRKGTCAAIEFIGGEMVCHTGETMPVKALTNNTYHESVRAWQVSSLFPVTNSSLRRFSTAANRVKSFRSNTSESAVDYAFDTLEKVSGEKVGRSTTFWSIVFDTENFLIYFRTKSSPHIRYINVDMLDFSCDTPAMMMDINEDLSGDVTGDLRVYSHHINLAHMTRFCEKWGLDISPSSIAAICQHFEGFPCIAHDKHSERNSEELDASRLIEDTSDDTNVSNLESGHLLVILVVGCIVYFTHRSRRGH